MSDIFMMRNILRVITPNEINDLTTTSVGENKVPLSEILDDEIDRLELFSTGHGREADNILLFRKKRDFRAGNSSKRLFSFLGLENEENVVINKRTFRNKSSENSKDINKKDNFLNAQESLRESQKKLKSAEVFQLYKKSSSISSEQIKHSKDDLSKSTNIGVLVNKKQA